MDPSYFFNEFQKRSNGFRIETEKQNLKLRGEKAKNTKQTKQHFVCLAPPFFSFPCCKQRKECLLTNQYSLNLLYCPSVHSSLTLFSENTFFKRRQVINTGSYSKVDNGEEKTLQSQIWLSNLSLVLKKSIYRIGLNCLTGWKSKLFWMYWESSNIYWVLG